MAGQAAEGGLTLEEALDEGLGLDPAGYLRLLEKACDPAAVQQLNAGTAAASPRLVVPHAGPATIPALIERHLIQPGRQGVAVAITGAVQNTKSTRIRTLPVGVKYGGGDQGRASFQPSSAPVPLIGKFASSRTRRINGVASHQVRVHKVHKVQRLLPYPSLGVRVASIVPAAGSASAAVVHTADPHPFTGPAQLASLAGLPGKLDGHYPVTNCNKKTSSTQSRTQFTIELFKRVPAEDKAALVAAVQQAAADGGVAVSEVHKLDKSAELLHLMLAPAAGAAAPAAGEAAGDGAQAEEPQQQAPVVAPAAAGAAPAAVGAAPVAGAAEPAAAGAVPAQGVDGPVLPVPPGIFPGIPLFDAAFGGGWGGPAGPAAAVVAAAEPEAAAVGAPAPAGQPPAPGAQLAPAAVPAAAAEQAAAAADWQMLPLPAVEGGAAAEDLLLDVPGLGNLHGDLELPEVRGLSGSGLSSGWDDSLPGLG